MDEKSIKDGKLYLINYMKNNYVVMMLIVVAMLVVAVSWLYGMPVKKPCTMVPRNSEQSGGDYWRTNGYPTKTFCERRNGTPEKPGGTRGMKSPQGVLATGCEKYSALWYPKCGKGYTPGGWGTMCARIFVKAPTS